MCVAGLRVWLGTWGEDVGGEIWVGSLHNEEVGAEFRSSGKGYVGEKPGG